MENTARTIPFPSHAHARTRRSSSSSSSSSYSNEQGNTTPTTYLGMCYQVFMGKAPTPGLEMALERWAEEIHEDVVEYAIQEASLAPRPSWAYINAILQRCRGIDYKPIPGVSIKEAVEIYRLKERR